MTPDRRSAGQYTFTAALPAPNGKGLGLINFRARWYDSALGRFAQADSLVPTQTQGVQAWDRYAYANNNPLNYTDPSGHFAWLAVGAIAGAIGGAIYGYGSQVVNNLNSGMDLGQALTTNIDGGKIVQDTVAGAVIGTGIGVVAAATEAVVGAASACAATNCVEQAKETAPKVADGISQLYRAVGDKEFADIMNNQFFQPKPGGGSMDAKWFWEGADSARGFMEQVPNLSHIVEAQVPTSILEQGYRLTNLDNLGPAVAFIDDTLDLLNQNILAIQEVIAK